MKPLLILFTLSLAAQPLPDALRKARDAQDRAALDQLAADAEAKAQAAAKDAAAQYRAALTQQVRAEVALELRDRNAARAAAEAGARAAERALALAPKNGEYHRVHGALCGQIIPANPILGLKYGRCAQEEIVKAIELEPKSALAHLSRGVGNYYLPPAFGGSPEAAVNDFRRAIELDAKSAEAHLWLGLALRKLNRNEEARKALSRSIELNPARVWAKQQLDKTPAQ